VNARVLDGPVGRPRDDRVLPETRLVGVIIITILVLAWIALWLFPERTDVDFAWTIVPLTSPVVIGAGYLAGGYFFLRVITEHRWHHVGAGFPAITVFTLAMLLATVLHLDRFHQGSPLFYLWTLIYVVTPVLVPLVWWHNRKTDPGTLDPVDFRVPPSVQRIVVAGAGIGVVGCFLAIVSPSLLQGIAPWSLTPLTARIFAGWSLLTFAAVISAIVDGRWSSMRVLLESAIVGQVLTLIALPRVWSDLHMSDASGPVFVVGLASAFVVLLVLRVGLERVARQQVAPNAAATALPPESSTH
jgi:hypothetical protein